MNTSANTVQDFLEKSLLPSRIRSSSVKHTNLVENAESDRGRVLYSAAFRRLQQKAQVFSLEPNAAVRSRLTHSLEVSQVGRYISDKIIEKSGISHSEISRSLAIFVETACLAHDIGNPPFGHFGEAAIQEWFKENGNNLIKNSIKKEDKAEELLHDFIEFDGNPQGLRILSKLQWNNDEYGLNLTTTSLLSCIKYLRCAGGEKTENLLHKKAGYFLSEENLVQQLWEKHNIDNEKPSRFPLAAIMEAADDISYCISDLEDSIEKSVVSLYHSAKWIEKEWKLWKEKKPQDTAETIFYEIDGIISKISSTWGSDLFEVSNYTFTDFRTSVTRFLVDFAARNFIQLIESDELVTTLLPEKSSASAFLEILKNYCREHVYCNENVELIEYAGYTAISGLLDIFKPLLSCDKDRFRCALNSKSKDNNNQRIVLEKKLLRLFPEKHIKAYNFFSESPTLRNFTEEENEWLARAHLIVDFLSGMTDDYSIELYRTLSGIKTS